MSAFDFDGILRQAEALKSQIASAQADLARKTVSAESGGGLVRVTANGLLEIVEVKLDPLCVDPRDVPMLESLVLTAANKALREARALAEQSLGGSLGALLKGP